MIPYLPPLSLGPVSSFGVLAFIGMTISMAAGSRHAERLGLDARQVRQMAICCVVGGVLGAHYVDLFLYQPGWSTKPGAVWRFLNLFDGISSYGGLIGGTVGFFAFSFRHRIQRLRFADVAMVGVVVFLTFGRAGCASVHDHVGVASDFVLAVDFPRGNPTGVVGPHHDLGLYELMLFGVLLVVLSLLLRKPRKPGWIVGVMALCYAVPRFWLDFLRRDWTDPRYYGLTPAQWSCVATVAAALAVLAWIHTRGDSAPEQFLRPTPWRAHARGWFRLRRA